MEQDIYLTFRSYVTMKDSDALKPEILGITHEHYDAVYMKLKERQDYQRYLEDVEKFGRGRRPLAVLPDLGVFSLVRHFQQQISNEDIFESSLKHVVSPIMTRSRTAAAALENRPDTPVSEKRSDRPGLDLHETGEPRSSTPSVPSTEGSLEGHSPYGESPLALRGRASHGPETSSTLSQQDEHSRSPSQSNSTVSARSAVSATAATILYAPTADETIVNTFLILLLNALGTRDESVTAEWVINRWILKHTFGASELEARTDGFLRTNKRKVAAIVEVKTHVRSKNKWSYGSQKRDSHSLQNAV